MRQRRIDYILDREDVADDHYWRLLINCLLLALGQYPFTRFEEASSGNSGSPAELGVLAIFPRNRT
jgi:hypothetical protein